MQEDMPKKILIVDDDKVERETYRTLLQKYGFTFMEAADGAEGLEQAKIYKPDLVLTDNQMPVMDGFTLCETIKNIPWLAGIPVIIISAKRVEEEDAVLGYKLGADDYIVKPASAELLRAKVLVVLKRYEPLPSSPNLLDQTIVSRLGISLDPVNRTVSIDRGSCRDSVNLTRKEFDILMALLYANGRLISANHLLETVWGYDLATYNDPHTVTTHVSTLRKKLGPKLGSHITAVTGYGYKFD